KVLTAPASAASTRSVTAPTRSGSRSSDHEVKSDKSPKSTVTTRRSVAGRDAAAGRAAPQLWQKRAPGTATVPHIAQVTASPTPQRPARIPDPPGRDRRAGPAPTSPPPATATGPHPRRSRRPPQARSALPPAPPDAPG